jgi:enolase
VGKIAKIHAREVLDSRGHPTVEVEVTLDSGAWGRAIAPSGASTGKHEASELRDGDPLRFRGRGVTKAVNNVNARITPALIGANALDQTAIDKRLIEIDGTPNKSTFGANALLGVSLAVAHAAAADRKLPLYRYLADSEAVELPVPMINIISGGLHAGKNIDLQDFLIIPIGAETFRQALVMTHAVYYATKDLLIERGHTTLAADEGGFGPALESNRAALDLLMKACERAGYRPGIDVVFALDVASTHFYQDGVYRLQSENVTRTSEEMVDLLDSWLANYPIISIEDGLAEEDWAGWQMLTQRLGKKAQLIGDDLFTTNAERLRKGVALGAGNAILIKVNQIGTLTEALEALKIAREAGFMTVVSARSGETEDSTIADIAVATCAGQIKIGSITRSERLAKYNQLLRIEEQLGKDAVYRGRGVFAGIADCRLQIAD